MTHPSFPRTPGSWVPADANASGPVDDPSRSSDLGFRLHHPGWTHQELGFDPQTSVNAMRAIIDRVMATVPEQGWTFLCAQVPLDPERLLAWDGLLGVVLQAARDLAPTVWDGSDLLLVNYPDAWARVVPMLNPGTGWPARVNTWADSIVELIDLLLDEQLSSSLLPDGCLNLDGLYDRWRRQVIDGRLRVISLDIPPPHPGVPTVMEDHDSLVPPAWRVPAPPAAQAPPGPSETRDDPFATIPHGSIPRSENGPPLGLNGSAPQARLESRHQEATVFDGWRTHPSNAYPTALRQALWNALVWLTRFEGVPLSEDIWARHGQLRRLQDLVKTPALRRHAPHLHEVLSQALQPYLARCQEFRAVSALGAFKGRDQYLPLLDGLPLYRPAVDIGAWHDGLHETFPWMAPVITALARQATIQQVHGLPLQWSSLLLLGDPGVGKTLFWQTAMARLGHPVTTVGIAGVSDSMVVKGTAAGWSSEKPCLPARAMVTHRCGNPVILLDELDRAGTGDQNGNVHDALLSLLDPGTAQRYPDECLLTDLDASRVSWVATAQDDSRLPSALRARFDVIEVKGPDWERSGHLAAAIRLGEDLAWQRWDPSLRTPITGLSIDQRTQLHRVRWTSLRSLTRAIATMLVDNLYDTSVALALRPPGASSHEEDRAQATTNDELWRRWGRPDPAAGPVPS